MKKDLLDVTFFLSVIVECLILVKKVIILLLFRNNIELMVSKIKNFLINLKTTVSPNTQSIIWTE